MQHKMQFSYFMKNIIRYISINQSIIEKVMFVNYSQEINMKVIPYLYYFYYIFYLFMSNQVIIVKVNQKPYSEFSKNVLATKKIKEKYFNTEILLPTYCLPSDGENCWLNTFPNSSELTEHLWCTVKWEVKDSRFNMADELKNAGKATWALSF